jgi:hypothetical protein
MTWHIPGREKLVKTDAHDKVIKKSNNRNQLPDSKNFYLIILSGVS